MGDRGTLQAADGVADDQDLPGRGRTGWRAVRPRRHHARGGRDDPVRYDLLQRKNPPCCYELLRSVTLLLIRDGLMAARGSFPGHVLLLRYRGRGAALSTAFPLPAFP